MVRTCRVERQRDIFQHANPDQCLDVVLVPVRVADVDEEYDAVHLPLQNFARKEDVPAVWTMPDVFHVQLKNLPQQFSSLRRADEIITLYAPAARGPI